MNTKIILLAIVFTIITGSCSHQKNAFPHSLVNLSASLYSGKDVKIYSEHNFNYVGRFKFDTTFIDHFGGGTYTLDGNKYEEHLIYDYKKDAVGATVKMHLELKNDTLIQTFPVDDNWQKKKDFFYIVKYVRIK